MNQIQGHKHRILIVEDEKEAQENLQFLLEDAYKITTANNSEEALKYFESGSVDLILLDINLGGEDGIALAQKLIHLCSTPPPIIFITGYEDVNTKIRALGAESSVCYITKPFKKDDLFQKIEDTFNLPNQAFGRMTARQKDAAYKAMTLNELELELNNQTIYHTEKLLTQFGIPIDKNRWNGLKPNNKDRDPKTITFHRFAQQLEKEFSIHIPKNSAKPKVMVIEDEPEARENLQLTLETQFQVIACDGVESGIKAIQENKDTSVILLDMQLQDGTGSEFLEKMDTLIKYPEKPEVITLTAFNDTQTITNAFTKGSTHFLNKPYQKEELIDWVTQLAEKKHYFHTLEDILNTHRSKATLTSKLNAFNQMRDYYLSIEKPVVVDDFLRIFPECDSPEWGCFDKNSFTEIVQSHSAQKSESIWNELLEKNYINDYGTVTSTFSPDKGIRINSDCFNDGFHLKSDFHFIRATLYNILLKSLALKFQPLEIPTHMDLVSFVLQKRKSYDPQNVTVVNKE